MIRRLLSRLVHAMVVVVGVSVIVFAVMHLTGDPAVLMLPLDTPPEQVAAFRTQMGLDDPLYVQYWRFATSALRGDFGDSIRHRQPALMLILERMPATLQLTGMALLITLLLALPLGVLAAAHRDSACDRLASLLAILGQSVPVFWLGLMLQITLGTGLGWFPIFGRGTLSHLILPSITLGLYSTAAMMRMLRSKMLEVLGQDYIRTAHSKGLSETAVLLRHALKNALLPVVTVFGLQLGALLGGAVITETIFAWPGVGRLMVQAISNRDLPLVQAGVLVLAMIIVSINLLTDVAYVYLDPRIHYN
ncbi:MAG TPA: ABC transporter permease [Bacillota bacterium]|nr:ABC transporter permease [Bacillota bacterium]